MTGLEELRARVISAGRCVSCGACTTFCPRMKKTRCRPDVQITTGLAAGRHWIGEFASCRDCDICYGVCPAAPDFNRDELGGGDAPVFLAGCICDEELRQLVQDGGVVTALTQYLVSKGGRVAVTVEDEFYPLKTLHTVISDEEGVVRAAGTKYGITPNVLSLKQGVDAFVGLGCHVAAIRRAESLGLIKAPLLIGIFCTRNISYQNLLDMFERLGVRRGDVQRLRIEDGVVKLRLSGGVVEVSLAEVKMLFQDECRFCPDAASLLADVSVGSQGTPAGWSTIVIRTKRGSEVVRAAEKQGLIETRDMVDVEQVYRLVDRKLEESLRYAEKQEG